MSHFVTWLGVFCYNCCDSINKDFVSPYLVHLFVLFYFFFLRVQPRHQYAEHSGLYCNDIKLANRR